MQKVVAGSLILLDLLFSHDQARDCCTRLGFGVDEPRRVVSWNRRGVDIEISDIKSAGIYERNRRIGDGIGRQRIYNGTKDEGQKLM